MEDDSLGARSDMSEEDIVKNNMMYEQQLYQPDEVLEIIGVSEGLRPTKRVRGETETPSNDEDDEGFTLVQRKSKRFARSTSGNIESERREMRDETNYEVCVTSSQLLPKQIGFAKLLKTEDICNITYIKYKSPYKVHMKFEKKESAEKLMRCEKFAEMGFRCHYTNEVSTSYGVVKYLELDVDEKEMIENITCEYTIISVKRLKRLSENSEWEDSETVRFGFKGSVLPEYVYGYGGRFKVDPYIYPVTQCSSCWKYGHLARVCPTKKIFCPKCGKGHNNCDTLIYKCINCKGNHMSIDKKKCPVFYKEKRIRLIMSEQNCTYKVALLKYNEDHIPQTSADVQGTLNPPSSFNEYVQGQGDEKSYRDALLFGKNQTDTYSVTTKESESETENVQLNEGDTNTTNKAKKKKKKSRNVSKDKPTEQSNIIQNEDILEEPTSCNTRENTRNRNVLKDLLRKSKTIIFNTEYSMEEKLTNFVQLCIEEIIAFVFRSVSDGGLIKKMFDLLHNG